MKVPKNSFTAALKDVEPPKDYSTQENRMKWYEAVVKAFNPIVGVAVDAVKAVGKKTKDDLQDVRDEFVDSVESTVNDVRDRLTGELVLEDITFHVINEMQADDLQYLANRISAMRENALKIERYIAQAAPLKYSKKVKTELTADQVEELETVIKEMIKQNV